MPQPRPPGLLSQGSPPRKKAKKTQATIRKKAKSVSGAQTSEELYLSTIHNQHMVPFIVYFISFMRNKKGNIRGVVYKRKEVTSDDDLVSKVCRRE